MNAHRPNPIIRNFTGVSRNYVEFMDNEGKGPERLNPAALLFIMQGITKHGSGFNIEDKQDG
jgi:hypothetical protein